MECSGRYSNGVCRKDNPMKKETPHERVLAALANEKRWIDQRVKVIESIKAETFYHINIGDNWEQLVTLNNLTKDRAMFTLIADSNGNTRKTLCYTSHNYFNIEFMMKNGDMTEVKDIISMIPLYMTWPWHSKKLERMCLK
jgi:hypothetical protein